MRERRRAFDGAYASPLYYFSAAACARSRDGLCVLAAGERY